MENFSPNLATDIVEGSEEVRRLREENKHLLREHAAAVELAIGDADIIDRLRESHRELVGALKHSIWMNKWQFDEHRTGGYGLMRDEASCRCDWCKTYRDTRYEDSDSLQRAEELELGQ